MFMCKSGLHFWTDEVDAKLCCNGHIRMLSVDSPTEAGLGFDTLIFFRAWRMTSPDEYDETYEPPDVGVERTVK